MFTSVQNIIASLSVEVRTHTTFTTIKETLSYCGIIIFYFLFLTDMIFCCMLQIVNIIASHPDHDIIIGIDSLGKEDLLLHISRMLEIKVCCDICDGKYMIASS